MILYFDKHGELIKRIDYNGVARTGTTNFEIFAYFEDTEVASYPEAVLKLLKPISPNSRYQTTIPGYYPLVMKANYPLVFDVDKLVNSETNYEPFVNEHTYYGYYFSFNLISNDEVTILLDTPGLWGAVVTLFGSAGLVNVVGRASFNVEDNGYSQGETAWSDESTIDAIMAEIAKKANIDGPLPQIVPTNPATFLLKDLITQYSLDKKAFILRLGQSDSFYCYFEYDGSGNLKFLVYGNETQSQKIAVYSGQISASDMDTANWFSITPHRDYLLTETQTKELIRTETEIYDFDPSNNYEGSASGTEYSITVEQAEDLLAKKPQFIRIRQQGSMQLFVVDSWRGTSGATFNRIDEQIYEQGTTLIRFTDARVSFNNLSSELPKLVVYQATAIAAEYVTGDYIPKRDYLGQIKVPLEPTNNSDATSKQYVDTKADKIGPLPSYSVLGTDNVYTFVNNQGLSQKPIILSVDNVPYFATFTIINGGASTSFEIERCDFGVSDERYAGSFTSDSTFNDLINSSYRRNYEEINNKVTSLSASSTNTQYPSAKAVYDLVQEMAGKTFTPVDISEYPTLEDFLEDYPNPEEGIIYLYPVDTSESPTFESGYYRYIWENNAWVSLGSTQMDLSNYYTKTETDGLLADKADKTGPLPYYEINSSLVILDFISDNNLNYKPFIIKLLGSGYSYICNIMKMGTTSTYALFEIERIGGSERLSSNGNAVDLNNVTFQDLLFSMTYRNDYALKSDTIPEYTISGSDNVYTFLTVNSLLSGTRFIILKYGSQTYIGGFYPIVEAAHVYRFEFESVNSLDRYQGETGMDNQTFSNLFSDYYKKPYLVDDGHLPYINVSADGNVLDFLDGAYPYRYMSLKNGQPFIVKISGDARYYIASFRDVTGTLPATTFEFELESINDQARYASGSNGVNLTNVTWMNIVTNTYAKPYALQSDLETKADKVGPLPAFEVTNNTNIIDFVTTNSINDKSIIIRGISGAESAYIGLIHNMGGSLYSFEFESLSSSQRYHSNGIDMTNKVFGDIISSTYSDDYELKSNKVTSISPSSTDTQYPSAKCVYDNLQNLRAVAEGKTTAYIVSYQTVAPTSETFVDANYFRFEDYEAYLTGTATPIATWADYQTYINDTGSIDNSVFNSQDSDIETLQEGFLARIGWDDDNNKPNYLIIKPISPLKVGDIIYVIEPSVPDRWLGSIGSGLSGNIYYALEGKSDLNNYYTKIQSDARYVKQETLGDAYDNTRLYAVGDLVIYNNKLYKCTTAITQPEDFDSTKWVEVSITEAFGILSKANTWNEVNTFSSGIKTSRIEPVENSNNAIRFASNDFAWVYNANINPQGDNARDLGKSATRWRDLYLSRNLTNGTNSVTVADIANGLFNIINASDIVSNTLTQAQYDLITNGKPTRVIGGLGGFAYTLLLPPTDRNGTDANMYGVAICQSNGQSCQYMPYKIVKSTLVISLITTIGVDYEADELRLLKLGKVNGKNIPNYPTTNASPQVLTIGANGGNLSWSDDGLFNVINATDIVNNTLTQAQYDLITNGKPTRIKGTFLNGVDGVYIYCGNFPTNAVFRRYTRSTNNGYFNERTCVVNLTTKVMSELSVGERLVALQNIQEINGKTIDYYLNNVYPYATNSTTELKYETINIIDISADTTFTLATAPANTYPEYKANITNTGASDITITLPSGVSIKGNVSISSNTFVIPSGSEVELNIQNNKAIVVEW